jgi:hypothetical protein
LVRRLAEAGVAFQSLLDGVLRERARAMLSVGALSRDEMAAALGYSDARVSAAPAGAGSAANAQAIAIPKLADRI